jgi:hypothetical protein
MRWATGTGTMDLSIRAARARMRRKDPVTTLLRTTSAPRALRPIVMTATLVAVPAGSHGPSDLPVTVDRAAAHALDRIALWAAEPAARSRAA